jgi:hypothetical protein
VLFSSSLREESGERIRGEGFLKKQSKIIRFDCELLSLALSSFGEERGFG